MKLRSELHDLAGGLAFVNGFPGTGKSTAMEWTLSPFLFASTPDAPANIVLACALNEATDDLAIKLALQAKLQCQDPNYCPIVVQLYALKTELESL